VFLFDEGKNGGVAHGEGCFEEGEFNVMIENFVVQVKNYLLLALRKFLNITSIMLFKYAL